MNAHPGRGPARPLPRSRAQAAGRPRCHAATHRAGAPHKAFQTPAGVTCTWRWPVAREHPAPQVTATGFGRPYGAGRDYKQATPYGGCSSDAAPTASARAGGRALDSGAYRLLLVIVLVVVIVIGPAGRGRRRGRLWVVRSRRQALRMRPATGLRTTTADYGLRPRVERRFHRLSAIHSSMSPHKKATPRPANHICPKRRA